MSSVKIQVTSHLIRGQHIREYLHATKDECAALELHIKEYRPLNNLSPEPGSITIIGFHANGFPKETYEPLWEDLLSRSTVKIRAIWIADCSHQGASGIANENEQGDDPSWFDHSRDVLHMINEFREHMIPPIFGIGHSMGAAQLAHLSLLHPRLFHSLALIEPVVQNSAPEGPNPAMFAALRPELWPSRTAAEAATVKNPMFRSFDPRVLKRYSEFAYRELPTALFPDADAALATLARTKAKAGKDGAEKHRKPASPALPGAAAAAPTTARTPAASAPRPVTLATTKHQETWSYSRANFAPLPADTDSAQERLISPDVDPRAEGTLVFVRPETNLTYLRLPELRPAVLWLYGAKSMLNTPELREKKMATTGTGRGGSGGVKIGKVKEVVVPKAGHMLPFEKVAECAAILAGWMTEQVRQWDEEKAFYEGLVTGRSEQDGKRLSKAYVKALMEPVNVKRKTNGKL